MKKNLLLLSAAFISLGVRATPTIYPKDLTYLHQVINPTNSNLVADDADPRVMWVMPPNVATSAVQGLHTITANVGFCREMANLQSYSATMSEKLKEVTLKEVESKHEYDEVQARLNRARQELARFVSGNNLLEIQSIDDRLAIIEKQIEELNGQLMTCEQNCNALMAQVKDIRNERNALTFQRREMIKDRLHAVREMERKKASVAGFEKELEDIGSRWSKISKTLVDLHKSFNDMYSAFGKMEGARAAIIFESNWDENIEELRRLNPGFDFKQIHTRNAVITTSLLGAHNLPGNTAIIGYEIAGTQSEGMITFPSYPQSLSGNVRLSLVGTCPILHPELFSIKLPNGTDQMKYGMVASFEFPSTFEVDVTATYNMYKLYQKIAKSGKRGGFFRTRSWSSVEEKTFFRDEFSVKWNEQDEANSLTEEQKADYEKEMRDNIFGRLAALGLPAVSNPGALVPPNAPTSGAAVLASSLARNPSCQSNIYCMGATIGLNVLDAIFGQSSSSSSYSNLQDVNLVERWSRKQVTYKPWITSYR